MEYFADLHGVDAANPKVLRAPLAARYIGIVLLGGFGLPEMATIVEAFQSANVFADTSQSGGRHYEVALLSAAGGDMASSSSVFVSTESVDAFRAADNFHALFLVSGTETHKALRDERLVIWLRQACLRSELVFPTGEGRPVLEAAGFGQTASSREREPTPTASCNGVLSVLQTALRIIHADLGSAIASQVADHLADVVR